MFKIIRIGEGEVDRFIRVSDAQGNEFEVFDDSEATITDLSKAFKPETGNTYHMNLMLFGKVVNKNDNKQYGKKIKFKIFERIIVGKTEFFNVITKMGVFLIIIDEYSSKINQSKSREGYFRYSRIDLIKLDDKVHPEF